jgi:hypothetical protein
MSFRVDVLSAAGVKSGPPITEVLGLSISDVINQVGEATLVIPAAIAAQRGLARGNRYQIYSDELGYLGEYTHFDATIDATAENISIVCRDSLIQLAERVAGFRRNFNNVGLNTVLNDLRDDFSPAWTVTYEGGTTITDPITFSVEGENYLRILDYMRQYVRGWFRRNGDREIRFGTFTSTTPVATFVAPTMVLEGLPTTQALITQITRTRAGSEVVNRVYPVGAGIGETKLDLRYSNRSSPYTVTSGVVGGGVTAYWLEDSASANTYGRVDRVVAWNEIRPITNSAADLTNAANALYDIASAYLQKYKSENDAYTLSAVEVPASLRVGDLVRVVYNGVAELENGTVGWLNVANNFFVTQITRAFDDSGNAIVSLDISANGDAIIGNTEILYDILADVQTLKLRTQPTQTYWARSSPQYMMADNALVLNQVDFNWRFGSELLAINELYLEVNVLKAYSLNGASPTITITATNAIAQNWDMISGPVTMASTSTASVNKTNTDNTTATNISAGDHRHNIDVEGSSPGAAGDTVYVPTGANNFKRGGAGTVTMTTAMALTGSHNHTQNQHLHGMDHKHVLNAGGNHAHTGSVNLGAPSEDPGTTAIQFRLAYFASSTLQYVDINGVISENVGMGTFTYTVSGTTYTGFSGYGYIRLNLVDVFTRTGFPRDLFQIRLTKNNSGHNPALVQIQTFGRVTIQPIAV